MKWMQPTPFRLIAMGRTDSCLQNRVQPEAFIHKKKKNLQFTKSVSFTISNYYSDVITEAYYMSRETFYKSYSSIVEIWCK